MHAWVRRRRGTASSALELATGFPIPAVPTGSSPDVLIRVSHVAVHFNSEMLMKTLPVLPFIGPWIPEIELSGEVVAAGRGAPAEVRDPCTHVIAYQSIVAAFLAHGLLAEYVRLPGSQTVRIDAAVDMASASGINCAGSTALMMIRTAGVREGHSLLVNGASGSVGSVLVQLCKLRGANVVGVASGANEAMVRGLGVDEFVDYQKHQPVPAYLSQQYGNRPFDFVLDCVGTQALFVHSLAYLKAEGAVVNIGAIDGFAEMAHNWVFNRWLPTWLGGVPRRYVMGAAPPRRDDAICLVRLIEEGRVRIPVDSVFNMADAVRAYECIATKRARGKVVVKVRSD
ncbi:hypothetical protein DV736_g381, partial [Chaetothyriales sp. CBS 134916]